MNRYNIKSHATTKKPLYYSLHVFQPARHQWIQIQTQAVTWFRILNLLNYKTNTNSRATIWKNVIALCTIAPAILLVLVPVIIYQLDTQCTLTSPTNSIANTGRNTRGVLTGERNHCTCQCTTNCTEELMKQLNECGTNVTDARCRELLQQVTLITIRL